jgi:hypothetical protein
MVKQSHYSRSISEHNVSGLVSHKLLKRVQAYHQYGVRSRTALYITKKDALDFLENFSLIFLKNCSYLINLDFVYMNIQTFLLNVN